MVFNLGMMAAPSWLGSNANAMSVDELNKAWNARQAATATAQADANQYWNIQQPGDYLYDWFANTQFGTPAGYVAAQNQVNNYNNAREQNEFQSFVDSRTQNQNQLQNAYSLTQGGGDYAGGVINGQYGMGTPDMNQANPWAQYQSVSYGGPMGGFGGLASQTYAPSPKPAGGAPSAWGGPFSNSNPWAAS